MCRRDLGHFCGRCDAPADRGGRQVLHVDACTNGALTGLEVWLDGIERGIFHRHDHDRCRQHSGQRGVLESTGQVFGGDSERE